MPSTKIIQSNIIKTPAVTIKLETTFFIMNKKEVTSITMHQLLLILLALCCPISALSSLSVRPLQNKVLGLKPPSLTAAHLPFHIPRGGSTDGEESEDATLSSETVQTETPVKRCSNALAIVSPILASLQSAGGAYSNALVAYPILTKSLTACATFFFSDFTAQKIEGSEEDKSSHDWKRTLTSAAVGLLYFGPAAHAWYEMIFKLLPGTSLFSTLQKAMLGQVIFGPAFTCVFFAVSLMQSGTFTMGNWVSKIKVDLPGAWIAGVGFWPAVDFISYAYVPIKYIPLFINLCSFVWTIYLSIVANKKK